MQEYLSLMNISAESNEGATVHDLYLDIFQGQILFLTGLHWSGKPTVKGILLGRTEIQRGRLYVGGTPWRGRRLSGKDALCVDSRSRFCNALTIHQNLTSLRQTAPFQWSGHRRFLRETKEVLAWAGIERKPGELVAHLSVVEKALLWLALARLRGSRLVIFDCVGSAYSQQELERIGGVLQKLKDRGAAILILDERPNGLMHLADRTAILRRGTVVKVLYPGEMQEETVLLHMMGYPLRPSGSRAGRVGRPLEEIRRQDGTTLYTISEGEILGICDIQWKKDEPMPDYLRTCCRLTGLRFPDFLNRKDTVYISESSGDCLFSSMDIGSNIALTVGPRLTGRMGILRPGMTRFLQREFIRKFQVQENVKQIGDLTCRERKLLSIYRFELSRPRVMLLENPMMQISMEDRASFQDYLRELAENGVCLIVSSKEVNSLSQFCDRIFLFHDHLPVCDGGRAE